MNFEEMVFYHESQ